MLAPSLQQHSCLFRLRYGPGDHLCCVCVQQYLFCWLRLLEARNLWMWRSLDPRLNPGRFCLCWPEADLHTKLTFITLDKTWTEFALFWLKIKQLSLLWSGSLPIPMNAALNPSSLRLVRVIPFIPRPFSHTTWPTHTHILCTVGIKCLYTLIQCQFLWSKMNNSSLRWEKNLWAVRKLQMNLIF